MFTAGPHDCVTRLLHFPSRLVDQVDMLWHVAENPMHPAHSRAARMVRKANDAARVFAVRRAVEIGLIASHRDYARFIILATGRSGSNLLRSLLESHPHIIAMGELFRDVDRIGWDARGYPSGGQALQLFREQPEQFLEQHVFAAHPKFIKAVGFKMFYVHARTSPHDRVWQYLRDDRALKVVHLKRWNKLRTHLSLVRAQQTNQWIDTQGAHGDARAPVRLDPAFCLSEMQSLRDDEARCGALFADHQIFDLTYETLVNDRDRTTTDLQRFLGVEPITLRTKTHPQSSGSLAAAILNYDELKQHFAATEWAMYFEK